MDESTKRHVRNNFPHIHNGSIYLNHAAISPLPGSVRNAVVRFLDDRNGGSIDNFEEWMEMTEKTRELIATLIGARNQENITFLGNTSDGLSTVAEGLAWKEGDEIVLNTAEFPSNIHPFRILEKRGVKLVYIDAGERGEVTPEMIQKAITPKTKLLSISAVQYLSGYRADLESIGRICQENGVIFCVDGIQALGATDIDVEKCNIDALATGCHKWLMSPMGIGFLYLSNELADKLSPAKTGWLSVEKPWDLSNFDQEWLPVSAHLETGTLNIAGITGLFASLSNMNEIGLQVIIDEIGNLSNYGIDQIKKQSEITLVTPDNSENRAGIITFSLNHGDPDAIMNAMKEQNITISVRQGYLRISPHYYNTTDEMDAAMDILKNLI